MAHFRSIIADTAWHRDLIASPAEQRRPTGSWMPSMILLASCLAPLVSYYAGLPEISGGEGIASLVAWLLVILSSGRVYPSDGILLALGLWTFALAFVDEISMVNAALHFGFLATPILFWRLTMFAGKRGDAHLRNVARIVVVGQVVMMAYQFATKSGIDDMKGTFVGTQYGEHIASFIVLAAAGRYAFENDSRRGRGALMIFGAMALAYLADSKIALGTFLIAGILYLAIGRATGVSRRSLVGRVALLAIAGCTCWGFYVGAFGNIPVRGYVDDTTSTGGGKLAVTELIVNPTSKFWEAAEGNWFTGAGPGQTVSRTAELTVPNNLGNAPARRLGATPSEWYSYFSNEALSRGYISKSSATAAASSLLGVLGDLGIVGLILFAAAWQRVYAWVSSGTAPRSWPALLWVAFLVPGYLGEWLEFPAACMFLSLTVVLCRNSRLSSCDSVTARQSAPSVVRGKLSI